MKLVCAVFLGLVALSHAFSVLPEIELEELAMELSEELDYPLEDADKLQFWDIWKIMKLLHKLRKCSILHHKC